MDHSFNIQVAKEVGIAPAVILNNFYWWIEKNKANGKNFHDGRYWTYNTTKAFSVLFPYLTANKIDYALKKLIAKGYVITGNYNKSPYDRTLWYSITEAGYAILQNSKMENTKKVDGAPENGNRIF